MLAAESIGEQVHHAGGTGRSRWRAGDGQYAGDRTHGAAALIGAAVLMARRSARCSWPRPRGAAGGRSGHAPCPAVRPTAPLTRLERHGAAPPAGLPLTMLDVHAVLGPEPDRPAQVAPVGNGPVVQPRVRLPLESYRTWGGFDWFTATVGGLWDSMLAKGRPW